MENTAAHLTSFSFANLPVRGKIVRLPSLHTHVPSLASAPQHMQATLAEMLTAAALLMADGRKSGISATLQIQHAALGVLLFAHCSRQGTLKAYGNPAAMQHPFTDIIADSSHGLFAVTLEPTPAPDGRDNRMQSFIPLTHPTVSQCVESYFAQAVQTPTKLCVFSAATVENGVVQASSGAIFLQKLPSATQNDNEDDDWNRLGLMLSTLKPEEILPGNASAPTLPEEELLHRLFAEDDIHMQAPETLTFYADNPRPRMLAALAALPIDELRQLVAQAPQGQLTLTDQTSGQQETFTAADLANFL